MKPGDCLIVNGVRFLAGGWWGCPIAQCVLRPGVQGGGSAGDTDSGVLDLLVEVEEASQLLSFLSEGVFL